MSYSASPQHTTFGAPLNIALDKLEDAYGDNPPAEAIIDAFTAYMETTGKTMYPHQSEALLAITTDEHLIIATPTGSGKSLIAVQAIFNALAHGQTAYYTAPLKALVSEKFFDLIALFGAQNVGMVTGDSAINPDAPIICATAEILANLALRNGANTDCQVVIMDEFHFYADYERGWAWQIPLITLPHTQFVLLSATLGDTTELQNKISNFTHRKVTEISHAPRPVPLHFSYSTENTAELIQELVATHMAPVYVVHFSQAEAVTQAKSLLGMSLISKEQKEAITQFLHNFHFGAGFGKELSKLLRSGIAVHHAGLLPRYRRLVEKLAQAGLLNVICGTDTLGVGINVPIRTVLLTALTKFDGNRSRHLSAREFHQIAGRAGRAGFDTVGYVVVQAPEHEIENARRLRKAGDDPIKRARVQKVKAPEGKTWWSEKTFHTLIEKQPEVLTPRMQINHAMLLNLMQREQPISALLELLTLNHAPTIGRNPLIRQAVDIYTSLRQAEVITHHDRTWRTANPDLSPISFTYDVPDTFALTSPLAPFALAALDLLDPTQPTYSLDVLSLVEAVTEDPTPVLIAQEKVAKNRLLQQLKAEGVEYAARMQQLDEVTWDRPLLELLTPAFQLYARNNPWVAGRNISPKSIVRYMIEHATTFTEFISQYNLSRSEGVLLRYLTDVYRTLQHSLPESARTTELDEITAWLKTLVRSIDASLLNEWEALANGYDPHTLPDTSPNNDSVNGVEVAFGANEDGQMLFTRNKHRLRTAIRNALFKRVEAIERDDLELLEQLDGPAGWDYDRWADAIDDYFAEYDYLGVDTAARSEKFFQVLTDPSLADLLQAGVPENTASTLLENHAPNRLWLAIQVLDDGQDDMAWALWAIVDLDACDEAQELNLKMVNFAPR